jgi:hypothetical protein
MQPKEMKGLRRPLPTTKPINKKKKIKKKLDPNKPGVSVYDGVRSIRQGYQRRKDILDQL